MKHREYVFWDGIIYVIEEPKVLYSTVFERRSEMKRILSKVWRWGKAVVVPAVAAAIPYASSGVLGPKAQAIAAAAVALYGVFLRSPKPVGPEPTEAPK